MVASHSSGADRLVLNRDSVEAGDQVPQKYAEDRDPSDFGLYVGHL